MTMPRLHEKRSADYIRETVQDAMGHSLETFSFEDIIDATDLSSDEKQWAKENLDWRVYFIDGETSR